MNQIRMVNKKSQGMFGWQRIFRNCPKEWGGKKAQINKNDRRRNKPQKHARLGHVQEE